MSKMPCDDGGRAPAEDRSKAVRNERRRRSLHGPAALSAMLVPALLFPLGLIVLRNDVRFAWVGRPTDYPWEFWVVAGCGTIATLAGLADWRVHRSGDTVVGAREHRAHVLALAGGGAPLFLLMAIASLTPRPTRLLPAVFVVLIATVVLICYDEFIFHRRCGKFETLMHRLLTFGNGFAFLAWAHWCFVRGGGDV